MNASLDDADHADHIANARSEDERIELAARWILDQFDDYYTESRNIPWLAKEAFERRDPPRSIQLSKRRLSMYSECINTMGPKLMAVYPKVASDEALWERIQSRFLPMIEGRYSSDLAFAFFRSVRRRVYQGEWKPVEYAFGDSGGLREKFPDEMVRKFPGSNLVAAGTVAKILEVPRFEAPYRDLEEDARLVAERINHALTREGNASGNFGIIEMIDAGFFRNRGCYVVGRIVREGGEIMPLVIALLNDQRGIYVDAVLMEEPAVHNIFSSTLANFHVTNTYYHELAAFLHSIMPKRPIGLHYSTIGFNHVGKGAVMNDLKEERDSSGEVFQTSVGSRGTVAIGFAFLSSAYNLKVIRDKPTEGYKWGKFHGIESVLKKYGRVHEINRTGSMLDNIIYYNLKLDRSWFDTALLEELLDEASLSVFLRGEDVIFKHLIVQRRQTPLPVFLETASEADAERAMINLGYCIKNNAAANIFNKDLDARNYGVSRYLKVHLYDYDALEDFLDVKIRTNEDRIDGEEDVPDWVFEDGVVFLPEEILVGLRIFDRELRRLFMARHGDLLTTDYWERIQNDLRKGKVPAIHIYPESDRIRREDYDPPPA
ncbi:MAG TPA: isocitrate dehydrogenase kinase/phosphatase AceK regulatory subunit [Gammaproteobacteria bacterium]|nr:isocitrate dehydrogenase kinase/phosphatase AceK regulatory subunit [Gammaproteobacteria bacterium]